MPLSQRPNLEWLRNAARELQRAVRAGETAAQQRFAQHLPGLAAPGLSNAQTVIAREQGFASWPALKAAVDARRSGKPPSTRRLAALAAFDRLIVDAAEGDPKALADRPGVPRAVALIVRDMLEARTADRAIVIATYLKGLSHPNPRVRFECAHALDTYGDVSCRAPLMALIDDPVPRVRWMAMHALSCDACKDDLFGDDAEVRRRIADRALYDPSVQVRRHAVVAVGVAGGQKAVATLQAVIARDNDLVVLRNAAGALRRVGAA